MRARPVYVAALALVLAGLAAYLVVPPLYGRLDRAAREEAAAISRRVPDPAGAVPMAARECGPGPPLRCVRVDRDLRAVLAELVEAVRAASGLDPRHECYESLVRTRTGQVPSTDCIVRAETGYGHAVMVQVETNIEQPSPDVLRAHGTKVVIGWY